MAEEAVSIKQINLDRIRIFMEQNGPASKSQISRQTGLSFPTVTRLVDELCAGGELLPQGTGNSTGGRCASYYQLNPLFHLYLLIQIEDGRVFWNLKDIRAGLVEQGEFYFQEFSLERLDSLIRETGERHCRLRAVSIGIAALVSRGVVEEPAAFRCLKGISLTDHLKDVTPLPVVFENDMNYLTMGCWTGRQHPVNSLITLFQNKYGMGGGMMINGKLWTGASGFCTEPLFLPFLEQYWEGLDRQPPQDDVTELYAKLIQIYTFTINPAMVVLYHTPFLEGKLDDIRSMCASCIPAKALPSIELSRDYQGDYERGLFAMARSISS